MSNFSLPPSTTHGQQLATDQLRETAARSEGALTVINIGASNLLEGWIAADVSVRCRDYKRIQEGLPLRSRERFTILIPPDFPFEKPDVLVPHTRFTGFPHVFWRRWLCLYQAPTTEWDYASGMYGFLQRLHQWLEDAALNRLDPENAPLHPPATFSTTEEPTTIVVRQDAPTAESAWTGIAQLAEVPGDRYELVGWSELGESKNATEDPDLTPGADLTAAALLLDDEMPYDFPRKAGDLLRALSNRDASWNLLRAVATSVRVSPSGAPVFIVIGTPMRGINTTTGTERRQHLTVWEIPHEATRTLRQLAYTKKSEAKEIKRLTSKFSNWASDASIRWCEVHEMRPEIVTRRDHDAPLSWFRDKRVAIWGCGALGGHVALMLARAGVKSLMLRDSKKVTPGVLIRQPYEDDQIGQNKAEALKERIGYICPELDVEAHAGNVLRSPLAKGDWTDGADLIIDATTSKAVLGKIEKVRRQAKAPPAITSMVVDQRARRGLVVLAKSDHAGGPADVSRRAKLRVLADPSLENFKEAFFMPPRREELFQPEPGCSDPTFIGSDADAKALAGMLLNVIARDLQEEEIPPRVDDPPPSESGPDVTSGEDATGSSDLPPTSEATTATAHLVSQPSNTSPKGEKQEAHFSWTADRVLIDQRSGYDVRIAPDAWKSIDGWIRRSERVRGVDIETGGLLFGEIDDAVGVVWISEAIGAPPDSEFSRSEFTCGLKGTREINRTKSERSDGSAQFIGMWHSHPLSSPEASPKDARGTRRLFQFTSPSPDRSLLLIIGNSATEPKPAAYLYQRPEALSPSGDTPPAEDGADRCDDGSGSAAKRDTTDQPLRAHVEENESTGSTGNPVNDRHRGAPLPAKRCRIALALSGGGSRAISFHLGCMRALHDRGILNQVEVISSVSGGSVISALYAYHDEPFEAFDERVTALLRRGLQWDIGLRALFSRRALESLATMTTSGVGAAALHLFRGTLGLMPGLNWLKAKVAKLHPPLRRASRTVAFQDVLQCPDILGERRLANPKRSNLDVVINAADLRSLSAFRFGSRESGLWRVGKLDIDNVPVAHAVTASAAYPVLLPALHHVYPFLDWTTGERRKARVVLTDGGVYDNLGLTCMEPSREGYGYNTIRPEYIVSCHAGEGLPQAEHVPYGWRSRMIKTTKSLFRKVQDGTVKRLHGYAASGQISGFVLAYLGQIDQKLPECPADLVPREAVAQYPTNFAPMSQENLKHISLRGEQLTRLLLSHYCPGI